LSALAYIDVGMALLAVVLLALPRGELAAAPRLAVATAFASVVVLWPAALFIIVVEVAIGRRQ
jgi:hypothetical protein